MRAAIADHDHPCIMHGAKATTVIGCVSDDEVLDGWIQAIPAQKFLFGRFTGIADAMGCECPSLVWVRVDRYCLDRIHAESGGECAGRGAPSD